MSALHERFPPLRETLPHVPLGSRPTPVRPLPQLADGGAPVWVKDEGRFGDGGWGGNKVRKLEWLIPDAERRGRRTILTFGGLGTNWGLAAALYARDRGLATALALVDQPLDDHVRAQLARLHSSGATLHFTRTKARTVARVPLLLARHADGARLPYVLPAGGSSPVGTLGYVEVALELAAQVRDGALPAPSHVVTAVGTGGTAAGLLLGLRIAGLPTRVVGVVVNDRLRLDARTIAGLARRTARLLRRRGAALPRFPFAEDDVLLVRDWLGRSYGHATPEGERAQALAASRAGLALEPVYTAKAMAALLALNAADRFGAGPLLFLHTDGPRTIALDEGSTAL
ncbi:1-aminocyclopropane-1-carboxylate deaminase/D-cysteine desulfhydrase [Conexibacter woesei]|uniref:Pyridoxal-5'-phosphate-dependent protein beta subunit n=1 Tax=Conexibacter woesei (strain DSM 14684 / CCUG 47730 / CIP 108061 / JCM 11494 / NBRC 100937 / ID131577) TaxID=469383 RepID=D3F4I4_CONWI|nr:pyridoxal-phosphate dependent enzyme [Conexibacter woesei]ADB52441.1 Pyridoxal-5'-phosphate-dependent protein beta subunit [Conexibacter woesei DSM 14684]